MIYPDYKNSIKNISATFSKYLGKEDGSTIKILEDELKKNYKNVFFIVFDGMGVDVLNKVAKNTIMQNNIKTKVTSVFPSTTTNATTTMLTNRLVDVHKYLAWSMYFKKLNRCVDIYMAKDSYTGEEVDNYLETKAEPYFFTFKPNRKICSVFPSFYHNVPESNIIANTIEELGEGIIAHSKTPEEKFVYCYSTEPDSTMHENGVTSEETKEVISRIDKMLKFVTENVTDTLLVLTADHGHIDVSETINIYEDRPLMECLARPLSMEPRAISFKLIKGKEEQFLKEMDKYSKDFTLLKADELINKGVFGNVDDELKDYLGDYIAIGTETNKIARFHKDKMIFKGHHTGMTEAEMYVPLIMIKVK